MAGKKSLYIRSGAVRAGTPTQYVETLARTPASRTRRRHGVRRALRNLTSRHEKAALLIAGFFLALLVTVAYDLLTRGEPPFPEEQIVATMENLLNERPLQEPASVTAYQQIAGSVVRVQRLGADESIGIERGVGTGVVIDASGTILTNFHVVRGADRVGIVFADGFETEAEITAVQPEDDLAVLQPEVIPEGLPAATLASSAELVPGDEVIAVGHPFGIGPSVSAGIVSGLGRSYFARGEQTRLDNLIQFDAAANPGNSGGPLVNRDGEVVGIVTSILNPTDDTFFVGIGFAVPIETAANAAGPNPF
jgi:S1-C subfamily serine protease